MTAIFFSKIQFLHWKKLKITPLCESYLIFKFALPEMEFDVKLKWNAFIIKTEFGTYKKQNNNEQNNPTSDTRGTILKWKGIWT